MMKYVDHVCTRARALPNIPVESEVFELIEPPIASYHIWVLNIFRLVFKVNPWPMKLEVTHLCERRHVQARSTLP